MAKCKKCGYDDTEPIIWESGISELGGTLEPNGVRWLIHELLCKKGKTLRREFDSFYAPKTRATKPKKTGNGKGIQEIVDTFRNTQVELGEIYIDTDEERKKWDKAFYGRNVRVAKQILELAPSVEVAKEAVAGIGTDLHSKGLSWSLQAVLRNLPLFLKKQGETPALSLSQQAQINADREE